MDINLTDREASLMEVLWERGPSTVAEVREQLVDDLAYATVLTMLRILGAKGIVTRDEQSRAHRYSALVDRDRAQRSALQALTEKLFQGSTELLMSRLVDDKALGEHEIERIRKLLDERAKQGKGE